MSRRTIIPVAFMAALTVGACSSGSSSPKSNTADAATTAGPPAATTAGAPEATTAAASTTAPARNNPNPGFDFVYDTVTGPYSDAKEWISRRGVSSQIPQHGYTLNNAVPSTDGTALLVAQTPVKASTARIAVIDLTGKVMRVLPRTSGCFPGGLTAAVVIVTCGHSEDDWQVLAIDKADHRRALGADNAGASAALSPDGTRVLAADGTQLYTVPTTGGLRKPLTDTGQARDTGAWSADGKHIVYLAGNPRGGQTVYVINADGTGKRKVGDVPFDGDLHVTVSLPGTRVLVAGSAQAASEFWTVGVDGSDPHLLSATLTGGDPHPLPQ